MNTPAHVAASVLIWRGESGWASATAIALGAMLPDLPMFGFYAYQRLWVGSSEREIWSTLYFQQNWQLFFDVFNSIPLAIAAILLCQWGGWRWTMLLASSALVHMLCDLPLHHDDAHRHFLPLTTWRFSSPVSYWDHRHFGHIFMWIELVFAIGACLFVAWTGVHFPMRMVALGTLAMYAAGIVFAIFVWM